MLCFFLSNTSLTDGRKRPKHVGALPYDCILLFNCCAVVGINIVKLLH
jgi:hypothetical protein